MVGFIFMVDEFRRDNGATRFVPGSRRWPHAANDVMQDATANYEGANIGVWRRRLGSDIQRLRVARHGVSQTQ